jgi:hypothetical protein
MKFIEILLNNSTVKEAKLYSAAKKASQKPDTGVTINNQAAYHVIKDSATIAYKYLPHYVFGQYQDPFQALKGKYQIQDIQEFLTVANSDFVYHQLLSLILDKVGKDPDPQEAKPVINDFVPSDDPYGEYGSTAYEENVQPVSNTKNVPTLDLLCEAFGVK